MSPSLARNAFVIVVLATIAATVFRVSTAPDRIKERRNTARAACIGMGGEWVQVGNDEICRRTEPSPAQQAKKT
ncbi:MAG TPA: hypothetical protein VFL64_03450 [Rhizobacter sp.]|nr:hypothetical protein [Rhizobacter sp.]